MLQITLRELEEAKKAKLCKSFEDLQDEKEFWEWDDVRDNRWTRLSKCVKPPTQLSPADQHEDNQVLGHGRRAFRVY